MKAIGFNQGQYGDLCINLVACKAFKRDLPNSNLYLGINKRYESLKEIFLYNNLIDNIHIWDKYDGWPSQEDVNFISNEKFDIVFNPMPKHSSEDWYLHRHQTEETCLMHGITPPDDLRVKLNKYFETKRQNKYVAVNLFAETRSSDKTPDLQQSISIVNLIKSLGYIPVQIGLPEQPQICDNQFFGSFFETIKFVLSCDFLVTVDSAISWIASGYSFPVVGIYAYSYYTGATTSKNWQPINKNAIYIEKNRISDITTHDIEQAIQLI
jgi:ADP-heptose:LPS heptosyltransferase